MTRRHLDVVWMINRRESETYRNCENAMLTKTNVRLFVCVCFFAVVFFSFCFSNIKCQAIRFDKYDYAFYLQFAAKLFDDKIEKVYSMNPDGANWLFFRGSEGSGGFHKTIHFEPIKYFYAVLYLLFGTPKILFLFISLVFFFPILYTAFSIPMPTKWHMYMVLFISVLYILYPASVLVPSYDLRPYIFLAPFFLLSFLSIAFRRPSWEIVLWFNTLFLAREEAIILGVVLLIHAFVKFKDGRQRLIATLFVSWLLWLITILLFVYWCGYSIKVFDPTGKFYSFKTVLLFVGTGLVCVIGIVATLGRGWLREKLSSQKVLEIVSISVIFLPFLYMFCKKEVYGIMSPSLDWLESVLFSPRYFLYFVALLCLGVILLQNVEEKKYEKVGSAIFVVVGLLSFSMNIASSHGIYQSYAQYEKEIESVKKVWEIRELTDKYTSGILVDEYVYQAFYDYQYVYVYNNLPWHVIPGVGRFYPANNGIVQRLVDERMEYIVANTSNYDIINGFLAQKKRIVGVDLFKDKNFFALQIKR